MSSSAQLRRPSPGSTDPVLVLAAVEAFPGCLAIIASGRIVYANPAWRGMFECLDPSQLQGRDLRDLIPRQFLAVMSEADPKPKTENAEEAHFIHTRGDGTRLCLEAAGAGFQLRGCEFQVIHTRDITRQKQSEKQLQESQRMEAVGRLVGGVAHDFNNLLTGMMLYCDLLIGELKAGGGPRRHAEEMRRAGEHGVALVQQLIAVARPSAEESQVFALNDAVAGVEDLLNRLIGENIVLSTSLAAGLGAVRMDPAQVQQILLNLVLNARDAMPDGGRITITTRNCSGPRLLGLESPAQPAPWVEVAVSDTGGGMDPETLDRAFEPFFTTKEPGRGSGLGLATARRLVQHEGGTITAESQPGKGTRVSVLLPRVPTDSPSNSKVKEVIS